ncbi:MAG: adenylate/guanylate cyclase domain-containing protein [Leptospiraceae bacterium]|nr:adenylate/guanylate cyclase domain-containing protein [Leptospiraceae bacterium]MCB1303593.1 adenylate/guanylate cyclase domain-containing protein [Leptospiraceae bacterium]
MERSGQEFSGLTGLFIKELDLFPVILGPGHRIRGISARLLRRMGLQNSDVQGATILKVLGIQAFQELFMRNLDWNRPLKNYRLYLRDAQQERRLYQLTAFRKEQDGQSAHYLLFQDIDLPGHNPETGFYEQGVQSSTILTKYVSSHLTHRARSASASGLDHIPDEQREFTFLFADLVSYTAIAERTSPEAILEMLNTSIGAASSIILHNHGFVDKIMGDSIFAVFENPLHALMSAIEMQKQFNLLNLFRLKSGEEEISIRIGIHSGECILGSIGGDGFLELTFIGDAVNTASRLEKACKPSAILVSSETARLVGDAAGYVETIELSAKGKSEPLQAQYLNRIEFEGPRGKATLGLDDDLF